MPAGRRTLALLLAGLLAPPAAAQEALVGRWVGSYVCAQGETGMVLEIAPHDGDGPNAVFHFYPLPHNPEAAEGCFEMRSETRKAGPDPLALRRGRWLLRPPDYVTVDLLGRIEADGETFTGRVVGPNCTSFSVRRGLEGPPMPPACRPAGSPLISAR